MKKLIAISFLFIISIQCLPVKELGKCLFDNSFVEEELCKKGIDKKANADLSKEFITAFLNAGFTKVKTNSYFSNKVDGLLPSPTKDVTTPPPNA